MNPSAIKDFQYESYLKILSNCTRLSRVVEILNCSSFHTITHYYMTKKITYTRVQTFTKVSSN